MNLKKLSLMLSFLLIFSTCRAVDIRNATTKALKAPIFACTLPLDCVLYFSLGVFHAFSYIFSFALFVLKLFFSYVPQSLTDRYVQILIDFQKGMTNWEMVISYYLPIPSLEHILPLLNDLLQNLTAIPIIGICASLLLLLLRLIGGSINSMA